MLGIPRPNPSSLGRSAVRVSRIEYKHVAAAGGGKARVRGKLKVMATADSLKDHSVVAVGVLGHTTQVASARSMTLDPDRGPARCRVVCRHELHPLDLLRAKRHGPAPIRKRLVKRMLDSGIPSRSCRSYMAHKRSPTAFGERAEVSLGGTALLRQLPSTVAGPTGCSTRPSRWPD